jgi:hypothetical protein
MQSRDHCLRLGHTHHATDRAAFTADLTARKFLAIYQELNSRRQPATDTRR